MIIQRKKTGNRSYDEAIDWYFKNANKINQSYSLKIPGTKINLVSPAEGIYKPATSQYAVSIKQTLRGGYFDQHPYYFDDGSCLYLYHQKSSALPYRNLVAAENDRKKLSSNLALEKSMLDEMPVGIVIQTRERKGRTAALYDIKIGMVIGWYQGYYIIYCSNENFELDDTVFKLPLGTLFDLPLTNNSIGEIEENFLDDFNPEDVIDERKKVRRAIIQREGQTKFRRQVLKAYSNKCAVSGTEVEQVLEAAHITPYLGKVTNNVSNGLLLRSDIHMLWDKFLLYIDPETKIISVSEELYETEYYLYNGRLMNLPIEKYSISEQALEEHKNACLRNIS